jgi:hypothetical protein
VKQLSQLRPVLEAVLAPLANVSATSAADGPTLKAVPELAE